MKHRSLPRHAVTTGVTALAHLLVLLLLGWKVPRLAAAGPAQDRSGAVTITLFRPAPRPRQRAAASPRSAPVAARPAPRILTAPAPGAPTAPAPAPPQPAPATPDLAGDHDRERLGSVLRGLTGCSDPSAYRLSREEREACDRRLAAARPGPGRPPPGADEIAQFNSDRQESIFTRKPHNQCLPGIGDRPPASAGVQVKAGSTTTFGLRCAKSF